jgi:hypothetical protein
MCEARYSTGWQSWLAASALDGLADAMLGKAVPDTRAIVILADEADEANLLRCPQALRPTRSLFTP